MYLCGRPSRPVFRTSGCTASPADSKEGELRLSLPKGQRLPRLVRFKAAFCPGERELAPQGVELTGCAESRHGDSTSTLNTARPALAATTFNLSARLMPMALRVPNERVFSSLRTTEIWSPEGKCEARRPPRGIPTRTRRAARKPEVSAPATAAVACGKAVRPDSASAREGPIPSESNQHVARFPPDAGIQDDSIGIDSVPVSTPSRHRSGLQRPRPAHSLSSFARAMRFQSRRSTSQPRRAGRLEAPAVRSSSRCGLTCSIIVRLLRSRLDSRDGTQHGNTSTWQSGRCLRRRRRVGAAGMSRR